MKMLSYDGVFAQIIRYIWKLFVLNLCFVLCCLPIVTAGAAIAALYSVFLNNTLESSYVLQFFRAFKSNFKRSTCIWLVFLGVFAVLGVNAYLLMTYNFAGNSLFKVLIGIAALLCLCIGALIFPLQAHFENTLTQTWRNAFILGLSLLPYSAVMTLVSFLPVWLFFIDVNIMVLILSIWLPLGGSLATQVNSWIFVRVINRFKGSGSQDNQENQKGDRL